MINQVFRSALKRNTKEFSYIKHVGVQSIVPKFQDSVKAFSSSSVNGQIHGVSRGLLGHNIGFPSLARWKSTKTEIADYKPLRPFAMGHGKSAGRNSQGRITSFHRGGGAKRLQRKIDLKRSTSAMGIVERIEYDPNRSSRIALVRWEKGVELSRQRNCKSIDNLTPPRKALEPTTTTLKPFSISSLPRKVDQRKIVSFSPGKMTSSVVIGLPNSPIINKRSESKTSSAKDIFFSTLSSAPKGNNASISFTNPIGLPKIAVAGAKPAFVASRIKEEVRGEKGFSPCEIRKLEKNGILRANKINRKAAVSWSSLGRQERLGLAGATTEPGKYESGGVKDGMRKDERAPVSYIIASHRMGPGQMVMNCDWSNNPSKI